MVRSGERARRAVFLFGLLGGLLACQAAEQVESMPTTAWTLADYTPRSENGIRVVIIHDMESLAGQSDPSSFDFGKLTDM